MRSTKGFTLIELLVVIAIIGILASIVMVSLSGAKEKSRDARRQADIKSIQLALSLYYSDNGMYPRNIYAGAGTAPASGLAPTYLPSVPSDPENTSACADSGPTKCYKYVAYSTGSANCTATNSTNVPVTYHLGAAMEDTTGSGGLLQDVDADNGGTYVYTGFVKCLGTGSNIFNGNATGCTGDTAATPDACYDVAP
ncbi:MAG: prepilin-type N-terminal cleavage/methylation domain-containing protein [Candidatus Pacebacteria bacterium]|nr:prepilin-type N-terminal cleavage/methylation domain-containing protein [Candidatus Paceibacterota bacterium]